MCIKIQTDYRHRVNATVNELVVTVVHDKLHMYSGLVALENMGNNDYKETESLCDNHDGTKDPSRSFYSHNSTLLITIYWYGIYSTITVRLSIAQTRCKPVYIDICYFIYGVNKMHEFYLIYVSQYSDTTLQ